MKLDKKFIQFYNDTFAFIDKTMGYECLVEYMKVVCPVLIEDFKEAVKCYGLLGARRYWNTVLKAEGADFFILYKKSEEGEELELNITKCSSICNLKNPYYRYCSHCTIMYGDMFRSLGYAFNLKCLGEGKCRITITRE